jgi:hypothetical protein
MAPGAVVGGFMSVTSCGDSQAWLGLKWDTAPWCSHDSMDMVVCTRTRRVVTTMSVSIPEKWCG